MGDALRHVTGLGGITHYASQSVKIRIIASIIQLKLKLITQTSPNSSNLLMTLTHHNSKFHLKLKITALNLQFRLFLLELFEELQ